MVDVELYIISNIVALCAFNRIANRVFPKLVGLHYSPPSGERKSDNRLEGFIFSNVKNEKNIHIYIHGDIIKQNVGEKRFVQKPFQRPTRSAPEGKLNTFRSRNGFPLKRAASERVHRGTKWIPKVCVTLVHLYSLNPLLPFTVHIVIPSEQFR